MDIKQNFPLKDLTSFKIGGPAEYFCVVESPDEIKQALQYAKEQSLSVFILGGGSNVVISDDGIKGLVIHPAPKGISRVGEDENSVLLKVAAGENWDEFVQYVINSGLWGIENLSYVPGSAGAFAVQNVGAYGQEASEVVVEVEAFDTKTGNLINIPNSESGFYYRHSIFNTTEKGRYIILNTTLKLSKNSAPNLTYPDLAKAFAENSKPTLREIRDVVIEVRNRKYPFPVRAEGGSVGSFFQNPILNEQQKNELRERIKQNFPAEVEEKFAAQEAKFDSLKIGLKISAFLIDICGLKGFSVGGIKVNENQPLVLLNKGDAASRDVLEIAQTVRHKVYNKTGITIPIEPELVGFSKADLDEFMAMPQP